MRPRPLRLYVILMCILAAVLLAAAGWGAIPTLSRGDYWGLATLALLALAAEQQALSIKMAGVSGATSIGFLPVFTLLLLFGPAVTVGTMVVVGASVEYFIRRSSPLRASFNVAQYVVATALGGMAFSAAGGTPLLGLEQAARATGILEQLGPFVLFGVVLLWVNNAAVALAIALSQEVPYREVWSRLVGASGTNILSDLLIGPIAIAVAALYLQVGTVGLLLAILPLFFIRHSYQIAHQLQLANRDLLSALVKAIETRDPYTSGHSLRVSHLARRIAERMNLTTKMVSYVETAGLLHDIGKIDAVYTSILRKPDTLTPEERAVIESHVTKGEELLRNLSTVPEEVVLAVRHHHEREDGGGYPDGLVGSEIPIGAKIIVACDSVDAMLSDRPYRKALPVPVVLQQLSEHAGRQFDPKVVKTLVDTGLLSEYADLMRVNYPPVGSAAEPVIRGAARTLQFGTQKQTGRTLPN